MHNINLFIESLLFIYVSFLIGNHIVNLLRAKFSSIQTIVSAVLIGYGFWGIVGFLLAVSGVFNAVLLRLVFVFAVVVSIKTVRAHVVFLRNFAALETLKGFFKENAALKGLVMLWLVLTLLITFMPITGHDTLKYHLPIIQDIIKTKSLTFSSDIYNYSYLPVLAEIIYAVPSVIFNNMADPYIFQVVQTSAFMFFLLLIYGFLKNIVKHNFLPLLAVLATLSIMDFQREVLLGGHIDTLMLVSALASMFILLTDINKGKIEQGNMMVSALLLGFALGMKYFAIFFVGFNGLLLIFFFLRYKTDIKTAAGSLLKYFSIPVIVSGFWYIKNLFVFGDPLYPIFRGTEFANGGWWVAQRTIGNLFVFPYLKWGKWFFDDTESSSALVVLGYFTVLYVLIIFFLVARQRFNFFEISLFISSHLYLWFFFFNSHHERYLLGSTVLLPILLVLLIDKFFLYFKKYHSETFYRRLVKIAIAGALVAFLFTLGGSIHFFKYKYLYLVGARERQQYIDEIGGL